VACQVRELVELVLLKGRLGADLREEAYAIEEEAVVRLWLDQSEHRADIFQAHCDIGSREYGANSASSYGRWEAMGIARPRFPEPTRERETKLFCRRAELLWLPVEGIWTPGGWCPLEDRLDSNTAWALIFMRARVCERSVALDLVPCKLLNRPGERLLFNTKEFMFDRWTQRRLRDFR
jgi:hypothetical protein